MQAQADAELGDNSLMFVDAKVTAPNLKILDDTVDG